MTTAKNNPKEQLSPTNTENLPMLTLDEMNEKNTTPAMAQYIEIKRQNMDYFLFYRMGDFYELFFEDAIRVANILGLQLTSRSKADERRIPMCGIPYHAYEMYLARLMKNGYKVAICEQMESPEEAKKRGNKAVVRREVTRLVTAGTITEETLLEAKRNNYIVATIVRPKEVGIAWMDISTGDFYMQQQIIDNIPANVVLNNILGRLTPAELLIEDKLLGNPDFYALLGEYREKLSVLPKTLFNLYSANNTLLKAYDLNTTDALGNFSEVELIAAGVLLDYISNTQKGHLPRLKKPQRILAKAIMEIDAATRRNLELINPLTDSGYSLLKTIDKTITSVGGRLLASRLAAPLINPQQINERLDAVSFFVDNPEIRAKLRQLLLQCMDMERSVQRLSLANGGPKDLYDLGITLKVLPYLKHLILSFATYQPDSVYSEVPPVLADLVKAFYDHTNLQVDIERTLIEDKNMLPNLARNGGFVRPGAYPELDYLKNIRQENDEKCEQLRQKYADLTGISALKIRNNSVAGYFIEVPTKAAEKMVNNPLFIYRQSVTNSMRFTTAELSAIETEVLNAEEHALELEVNIYNELVERVLIQADAIARSALIVAKLDVASAAAELATEQNYTRPLLDDSYCFEITDGRHPVVEAALKHNNQKDFIGNDCILDHDNDRIWLLTGPNMAGKSTFLRQNALIAILAQTGYFVPAQKAHIGIINKLFSRVGASDDLARGRSTFMVEMVETAAILNRADERSFVILDEIGRGTATFDGLSIAWAVVEHLAEINKCRTLFATHYHELTKLTARLKSLSLHCMKIKEYNDDIIFMHEVIDGAADRSYGIHVAKLAGLPQITIKRATQVLALLEQEKPTHTLNTIEDDLPLFEALRQEKSPTPPHPLVAELKALDLDGLSPRDALAKLYELKNKAGA